MSKPQLKTQNYLSIDLEVTSKRIIEFLKNTVHKAGFSKVVIGLSGGVDSAIACCLAVEALGVESIYVGIFPYGKLNEEGLDDAKVLIKHFHIPSANVNLIDIKPLVVPIIKVGQGSDLNGDQGLTPINYLRKGNIMVRLRMTLLYDLAKKHNALVIGTENKTEQMLGYFTRFGDEASDIEPIRGLYKTQVKLLAKYLQIPKKIIDKAPTAGLWNGQTDEGEFGFTYEQADQILYLYKDKKYTIEKIISAGFSEGIIRKVLTRLEQNKFKHELPYITE